MFVDRELDHAMLRRLEKRILVDLPTRDARKHMFEIHLPPRVCTNENNGIELTACLDYEHLADVRLSYMYIIMYFTLNSLQNI